MKDQFNDMSTAEVLEEAFKRLQFIADHELDKAEELFQGAQSLLSHAQVRGDGWGNLDNASTTMQKAVERQKKGQAYLWAIHDLKCHLGYSNEGN